MALPNCSLIHDSWIEGAKSSAEKLFTGAGAELNMAVMSCTLERVQMYNILYKSEDYDIFIRSLVEKKS